MSNSVPMRFTRSTRIIATSSGPTLRPGASTSDVVMRRTLATLLLLAGLLVAPPVAEPAGAAGCAPAGGAAAPAVPRAAGDFVFAGRGFGHGIGMSQYGARGAARLGCTAADILTTYYSGVRVGKQSMPNSIRVGLVPNAPSGVNGSGYIGSTSRALTFRNVSQAAVPWLFDGVDLRSLGGPAQPSGATWRVELKSGSGKAFYVITRDGTEVWRSESRSTEPGRTLVAALDGKRRLEVAEKGRSYLRGRLELHNSFSGMTLSAVLPFEQYLYGLAEMPSSWETEALRSQAIVGRSYAAVAARGSWRSNCRCDLFDSMYDQVYAGWSKESEGSGAVYGKRWTGAVDSTAGTVIQIDGTVVTGNYASSHGGHSEDVSFVWGGSSSHLRAIDDSRWEAASDNPLTTWTATFSPAQLGSIFGVGTAVEVRLPAPRGVSGRIGDPRRGGGGMTVVGTGGTVTVSGDAARSRLGLRSTLFTVVNPVLGGIPVTGDWNGDGATDIGWFRDGEWSLRLGPDRVERFRYGRDDDLPITGDWDGDGVDTIGIVRAGGQWHLRDSHSGGAADRVFTYGRVGTRGEDVPLVGDWDGDGRDTVGIVRDGQWHLRHTLSGGPGQKVFTYGRIGPRGDDLPLVGDWNGNGRDTVGIVRDRQWHLRNSLSGGRGDVVFTYGRVTRGDVPVTGDWDGDGRTTAGIERRLQWYLRQTNAGGPADLTVPFPG